jgi:light-regulated signal transduction histidine kinase (bacteriophytochrome)
MYNLINGLLAYSRINLKEGSSVKLIEQCPEEVLRNLSWLKAECRSHSKQPSHYWGRQESDDSVVSESDLEFDKFSKASPKSQSQPYCRIWSLPLFSQDEGIGIDKEYFDRIFLDIPDCSEEEYEGTGIGLSRVRGLLKDKDRSAESEPAAIHQVHIKDPQRLI